MKAERLSRMKISSSADARTCSLSPAAYSQIDYDRHIAFDNSISSKSFYYSHGSSIAPSELELVNGRFPVETNHSVTPPNSLRLKWRSRTGGGWTMELQVHTRYGMPEFNGSNLYAWCYSEEGLDGERVTAHLSRRTPRGKARRPSRFLDRSKTFPRGSGRASGCRSIRFTEKSTTRNP